MSMMKMCVEVNPQNWALVGITSLFMWREAWNPGPVRFYWIKKIGLFKKLAHYHMGNVL